MKDTFFEDWFSVPILVHQIVDSELRQIQKEIEFAVPLVRMTDLTNPWSDNVRTDFKYGKYSKEEKGFLHQYGCKTLIDKINKLSEHFLVAHKVEQNLGKFEIINSWINFNENGSFQYPHSHDTRKYSNHEVYLSGTYFFDTNGKDGDITFISPNILHVTESDIFSHARVSYKPEIGKLLMFPSWLSHQVGLNKTDNLRISISFNIGLYKKYI